MNDETVNRLLSLNRQFYQTFAVHFSDTRQRLQPGVQRIVSALPEQVQMLDLGCGNGEFFRALQASGRAGRYVGLDFSAGLLELASQPGLAKDRAASAPAATALQPIFIQADLAAPDWQAALQAADEPPFDTVVAFAVLHHLPGASLRLRTLRKVHALLRPGGQFIHSHWQFLNSSRLLARQQPWKAAGVDPAQVEPGDALLDWRRGGHGLRYVHQFDEAELADLAQAAGFQVTASFYSDGENRRLGLYQIWVKDLV